MNYMVSETSSRHFFGEENDPAYNGHALDCAAIELRSGAKFDLSPGPEVASSFTDNRPA
jgi:hypothetical protein